MIFEFTKVQYAPIIYNNLTHFDNILFQICKGHLKGRKLAFLSILKYFNTPPRAKKTMKLIMSLYCWIATMKKHSVNKKYSKWNKRNR